MEKHNLKTVKPKSTRKKFKTKVLKIFILITLAPLFIVSLSNLYLVVKTRQQNILEIQNLAIENAQEKIIKYLNEKSEGLNLVVTATGQSQYQLQSIRQMPVNNLYFLLNNAYNSSQPNTMDFIDQDGYIIVKINNNGSIAFNRDYLDQFGDEILYTDKYNREYAREDVQTISQLESDVRTSEDYLEAIKGEQYFGSLEFVNNRPMMRMASQIRNENDEIIGVVSAEIGLTEVSVITNDIILGSKGYLYAIAKNGQVIASGNTTFAKAGDNLTDIPLVNQVVSKREALGLEEYKTYNDNLGKKVVFAGQPMTEIDWFVFSQWPHQDAFSVINNILMWSIIIAGLTLLLIIILGAYFAQQIIRPINILSKGAREISQGNLEYRLKLKTNDEFEVLGEQFNEMIKILKENRKLRDEFVFIAAHELRTPVTAIRGYVSMILEKTFGEVPVKIKENLLIVNRSNDRLVQLVQDLLEVARSEAGKMKIEMKEANISSNVKVVMDELKSLSDEKSIRLIYNKPSKEIKILADSYKLNEVITNLVGNAIKYTLDKGSIEISHEQQGDMLITHIKDHGMGMSEENMKKLFSKFYRVQTEQTNNIEGTGLGLFICKEIVERMNGKIWVKSKVGEGSTFSFSLKLA